MSDGTVYLGVEPLSFPCQGKHPNPGTVRLDLLHVAQVRADDYEVFLAHNYHRDSGMLLCHVGAESCCGTYAVRLNPAEFKPSKSQRHVRNRFARYLATGHLKQASACAEEAHTWEAAVKPLAPFTDEDYELVQRYMEQVHHKKQSHESIDTFLGTSVLVHGDLPPLGPAVRAMGFCSFGTHVVRHRIDGRLVALNIVDLLPHTLQSYSCNYDPGIGRDLALGVVTALYEIDLAARLQACGELPGFAWYQIGEYKRVEHVRYTLQYQPCELYDEKTGAFVPYSACKHILASTDSCEQLCLAPADWKEEPETRRDREACSALTGATLAKHMRIATVSSTGKLVDVPAEVIARTRYMLAQCDAFARYVRTGLRTMKPIEGRTFVIRTFY